MTISVQGSSQNSLRADLDLSVGRQCMGKPTDGNKWMVGQSMQPILQEA
jgi:hypothetical protein